MAATTGRNQIADNGFIRELLALDLDPGQFVVFGSAPLLVHGLRTAVRDLDVVARGDVMAWARRTGTPGVGAYSGDPVWQLCGGRVQFSERWITNRWDSAELIENAEVVGGLRFARLRDVLDYKLELRRPKDLADIERIREHLRKADQAGPRLRACCAAGTGPAAGGAE